MIAFDEIGAIPTEWATGFFGAIRSVHRECQRELTIILAGATDPRDMIRNRSVSPFNIATHIPLHDFSLEELRTLTAHLDPSIATADTAEYIHDWTGGQPFLSHLLCRNLAEMHKRKYTLVVESVVEKFFMEERDSYPRPSTIASAARPDLIKYLCSVLLGDQDSRSRQPSPLPTRTCHRDPAFRSTDVSGTEPHLSTCPG